MLDSLKKIWMNGVKKIIKSFDQDAQVWSTWKGNHRGAVRWGGVNSPSSSSEKWLL